ncbi:beta-ketoacyl synthase chain length factor [Thalassospira lucentensis]|uniref:beta-ketoacyl synthase chain length factor n=1 Tax=Thalassospira lucentensis TaxID=168935 RepID=UPI003D2F2279
MNVFDACISRWAFWDSHKDHAVLECGTSGEFSQTIHDMDSAALAKGIKPALRRRLDLYGRAAAEMLSRTLKGDDNPHIVFASRHGNLDRTLKLIHQVATDELLSPADFGMSVHNALVGIASINWSITESHTAISAGNDTLISALTETLCQLGDTGGPVILVYIDLVLPEIYQDVELANIHGMALGLRFEPTTDDTVVADTFSFSTMPARDAAVSPRDQARSLAHYLQAEDTDEFSLIGKSGAWNLIRHD